MNLSVVPGTMVDWDEAAWDTFIFSLDAMENEPNRCWEFWEAICKNFRKLSPGCQAKALVAADRLILQIREDMERAMATLHNTHKTHRRKSLCAAITTTTDPITA